MDRSRWGKRRWVKDINEREEENEVADFSGGKEEEREKYIEVTFHIIYRGAKREVAQFAVLSPLKILT